MNVFFVLSPFQVINAVEAKAYFGTQDNVLVVFRHTSSGYPISMFREVIDASEWAHVYYEATYGEERIGRVNKYVWAYLSWVQQRRLERLAHALGRADTLFVGSYLEPLVRHFCNTLPHDKLCILDSGTDTLMVNRERRRVLDNGAPALSRMAILSRMLGVRDKQADEATFFTLFDIDVRPGDTLVPNRYTSFRALTAQQPAGPEVWFLGGSLIVDEYVSEEVYLDYLQRAHRFYAGQKFVYLPHGREQAADVEKIANLLGCEVRRNTLPVELEIARARPRPREIASFITTALTSSHAMFGDTLQVTAVFMDPAHFPKYHTFVSDIYAQFRQESDSHFRVIEV